MGTNEFDINKIWQEYKKTKSQEARDKLILHYAPLVKYVASKVFSGLPQNIELADLISYGIFGLIDAIDKFDFSRGTKFETYAISRIKGAIIDELRALDWVPRSLRHKSREVEKVYLALENRLKRVPTDEELAEALGISLEELHDLFSRLSASSVIALEELLSIGAGGEEQISLIDTIEDTAAKDPSLVAEHSEMKKTLLEALTRLPERERTIVALYYYKGLTLREIGEILGITESRVSQLHNKALFRLKARLKQLRTLIGSG